MARKKFTCCLMKKTTSGFNVKNAMAALGYKDPRTATKEKIDKKYAKRAWQINTEQMIGHPHILYVTESGLYRMVGRSRLPEATAFMDWVYDDVIPSIRKFGKYKLKIGFENEMTELKKRIEYLERLNEIYKNDLKKEKYPDGGLVYVAAHIIFGDNVFRLGSSGNLKKRKPVHDSHNLHNPAIVYTKTTTSPIKLETCVRAVLYDYRYKNNKDFYECDLDTIKDAIKKCSRMLESISKSQKGGSKHAKKPSIIESMMQKIGGRMDNVYNKINKLNEAIYD